MRARSESRGPEETSPHFGVRSKVSEPRNDDRSAVRTRHDVGVDPEGAPQMVRREDAGRASDGEPRTGAAEGLAAAGFSPEEVAGLLGGNWLSFFERSFGPA